MKYMVMECHPSYAVLLDENGIFCKAANLHYEIGEIVENPVLMRDPPPKRNKIIKMIGGGIAAAAAACILLIAGTGYYRDHIASYSSIYLTINPEIQMDLNRQGTVVDLEGLNHDGERLLDGYNGDGKDKVTVTDELIDRAVDMGFLTEGDRVVISIDTPDETLFREYGVELRTGITEHLDGRIEIAVEIYSYGTEIPEHTSESAAESTTAAPATEAPTTEAPATAAPTTAAPATEAPTTAAPATEAPAAPAPTVPATAAPAPTAPATAPATAAPPADDGDSGYDDDGNDDGNDDDDSDDDGDDDDD